MGCHSHCYPNGYAYNRDKLEILLNAGLDVDTPGLLHSSVAGSRRWANVFFLGRIMVDFSRIDSGLLFLDFNAFLNAWVVWGVSGEYHILQVGPWDLRS